MFVKTLKIAILSALLGLISSHAFAVAITSEQEIAGTWLLEYTKKTEQDSDPKPMGITWVLKDKKLVQKGIPQARGGAYDSAPMDYLIENGNLKVGIPGRAGKFDEYSLVEKNDSSMTLKDPKFGTLFYFSKK